MIPRPRSAHAAKNQIGTRESLWSPSVLMGGAGVGAGLALPALDRLLGTGSGAFSPSTAASLVSSGASALATILGVASSVTLVTLQLATGQDTSRVLRRFMADRLARTIQAGTVLATTGKSTIAVVRRLNAALGREPINPT